MRSAVLLSGGLVMLRQLPWTPSGTNPGSYTWASHDDRVLADQVAARTPRNAVILTGGRPNDPLLILAGRTAVMGYPGWLNSYGTDFGSRPDDVRKTRTPPLGARVRTSDPSRLYDALWTPPPPPGRISRTRMAASDERRTSSTSGVCSSRAALRARSTLRSGRTESSARASSASARVLARRACARYCATRTR